MTDQESDMKSCIQNLHWDAVTKKQASNSYVSENAWLDLTSSWSIKDLERNFKTFPESHAGSHHTLIVWVIMDMKAEDPRTKSNVFRVPFYDSEVWATMKSLNADTIKGMNIVLAAKVNAKPTAAKMKKGRTQRSRHINSPELVESDSDSDEQSTKKDKSIDTETKTISKDPSFLIPEIIESGQVEADVRHRDKLSGLKDIQQSMVTSSPNVMTMFGQTEVQTQLSAYLEKTQAKSAEADTTTVSAAQVFKGLNYSILNKDQASNVQSTSKDYDLMKEDDDEKADGKIDDEGFKIPQGIAHRKKNKLDADERHTIIRARPIWTLDGYD